MSNYRQRVYEDAKCAYSALMKCYPLTTDDLPDEVWLPIPDYEGYQISNYGRVKSFKHKEPHILKPAIDKYGYLKISLNQDGKQKLFSVHRLVALAFIPNLENKPQIDHIDGHKFNNHVSNLRWVTDKENKRNAYDLGLKKHPKGEDSIRAKLTNEQARFIKENPLGLSFSLLARMFGVCIQSISNIHHGKTYKNAGGFGCSSLAKKYGVAQ